MKAAIYNPYLNSLGGGERYTISFAKVLAEEGFDVEIEWEDSSILDKLSNRFGLKLPYNIRTVKSINRGDSYDICFWVSDGSIPLMRAVKNYIHFQIPFHDVAGKTLLNKMKFFRINKSICNSEFTKKFIDKEYGIDSIVLYPPVSVNLFKPKRKLNQICYVGRFSNLTQNKGQDVLIEQFKILSNDKNFKDWKLILAGGTEIGSDVYLKKLKGLASGCSNIEFVESPSFESVKSIFGSSKLFWSGAGYGTDEDKNPEKSEHFGITLVEAMAAGCVPVVFNSGGHKEIIDNGKNGFLWQNREELVAITKDLVKEAGKLKKISKISSSTSKKYSYEEFKKSVKGFI